MKEKIKFPTRVNPDIYYCRGLRKDQQQLEAQLKALQRLTELQDHRLAELEREIRLHAPELAKKLGLG